jgi:hypothetical protein
MMMTSIGSHTPEIIMAVQRLLRLNIPRAGHTGIYTANHAGLGRTKIADPAETPGKTGMNRKGA